MASLVNDPNGRRRIQFVNPDGQRKTIRLGKVSKRNAEAIKWRVEKLLECKRLNQPIDGNMTVWIADLDTSLASRLARVGLIAPRAELELVKLEAFLEGYVSRRTDAKPATIVNWGHTLRNLVAFSRR